MILNVVRTFVVVIETIANSITTNVVVSHSTQTHVRVAQYLWLWVTCSRKVDHVVEMVDHVVMVEMVTVEKRMLCVGIVIGLAIQRLNVGSCMVNLVCVLTTMLCRQHIPLHLSRI